MSQLPLPPDLEALLASWRGRLPIGTTLEGYVSLDPGATVIYATQPSFTRGEHAAASVWISREASGLHGTIPTTEQALAVLVDLAMRRTMPRALTNESAPMVALLDSEGLKRYSPPLPSPRQM